MRFLLRFDKELVFRNTIQILPFDKFIEDLCMLMLMDVGIFRFLRQVMGCVVAEEKPY